MANNTTKDSPPYEVMGIYKLPLNEDKNGALEMENEITLMYMKSMKFFSYSTIKNNTPPSTPPFSGFKKKSLKIGCLIT
jgi:hypothetical protein